MRKPNAGCQRCIAKEATKSPAGSEPGCLSKVYVAYWLPVNLRVAAAANAMKSQPTGLWGLREATRAPTVAKGRAAETTKGLRATSLTGHSRNPRQIPPTIRAHKGQANQATLRWPSRLTPRSCSLAPSVTTPLYSTTVSRALRLPLRSRRSRTNFGESPKGEVRRIHIPRTSGIRARGRAGALTGRMREASPAGIMAVGERVLWWTIAGT